MVFLKFGVILYSMGIAHRSRPSKKGESHISELVYKTRLWIVKHVSLLVIRLET
jgi:hypothetical protein